MRKAIYAAVLTASVLGLSSSAFAVGNGHMAAQFGPVYEMEMSGHKMHMQVISDEDGNKYVVLPMEDAEMVFGAISHPVFASHMK